MATRKRSSRPSSRSTKRASSRGSSKGSVVALAAIVGVGALSIWATTQHKSPQAALTGLFDRPSARATQTTPVRKPDADIRQAARNEPGRDNNHAGSLTTPAPRPAVAVGAPTPKPLQQQAALQPPPLPRPALSGNIIANPRIQAPAGTNLPNRIPSVVYARERVTLRRNAWDKSAPAGTVEKGREMRSYGQTGKWHRIVVPATNMIGWVHEDMLIAGKAHPGISTMTTGSISATPKAGFVQPAIPSRPVGAQ